MVALQQEHSENAYLHFLGAFFIYDFWETDIGSAQEIASLLGKLSLEQKKKALLQFLRYKYSDFDLDKSFTEQFRSNNQKLLEALRKR